MNNRLAITFLAILSVFLYIQGKANAAGNIYDQHDYADYHLENGIIIQTAPVHENAIQTLDGIKLIPTKIPLKQNGDQKILGTPFEISGLKDRAPIAIFLTIPERLLPVNPDHVPFFSRYIEGNRTWQPIGLSEMEPADMERRKFNIVIKNNGIYAIRNTVNRAESVTVSLPEGNKGKIRFTIQIPNLNSSSEVVAQLYDANGEAVSHTEAIYNTEQTVEFDVPCAGKYTLRIYEQDLFFDDELWSQDVQVGGAENPESYASLASRYAPIYSFYDSEAYSPLDITSDSYFSSVKIKSIPGFSDTWIGGTGEPDAREFLARHGHNQALMDADAKSWASPPSPPGNYGQQSTIFWQIQRNPAHLFITYWMFFRRDEKISTTGLGSHDRDRECSTVVLEKQASGTYLPVAVLFWGHMADQTLSMIENADGLQMTPAPSWPAPGPLAMEWQHVDKDSTTCTHPIIYVAVGTHAQYPRRGRYRVNTLMDHYEFAGGGTFHCPDKNLALPWGEGCHPMPIQLLPFGTPQDFSYSNYAWKHFAFSGYWIDGLSAFANSKFPPFTGRYNDIPTWTPASMYQSQGLFPQARGGQCRDACIGDCDLENTNSSGCQSSFPLKAFIILMGLLRLHIKKVHPRKEVW